MRERPSHQRVDVTRCQVVHGSGKAFRHRCSESIESTRLQGTGPGRDEAVHENLSLIAGKRPGANSWPSARQPLTLYGSGLAEYEIKTLDHQSYEMRLRRCFAYENIVRAGIKDQYECGILARVQGWIDAQGLEHELDPPLGKCMMVSGKECSYTIKLNSFAFNF